MTVAEAHRWFVEASGRCGAAHLSGAPEHVRVGGMTRSPRERRDRRLGHLPGDLECSAECRLAWVRYCGAVASAAH